MIYKFSGAQVGATTGSYASGDLIGGKLTMSGIWPTDGREDPVLTHVTVHDASNQKVAMTVVIFDSDPSATSFTNAGALDIADADLARIVGIIPVAASDYVSFADNAVATVTQVLALRPNATTNLYACLVTGGAPSYAANELGVAFGIAF